MSAKCGSSEVACRMHRRYDSNLSSTYVRNGTQFNIEFNDFIISGFLSADVVRVGNLTVPLQTFGEATHVPSLAYSFAKFDGVIGLGFDTVSVLRVTPIWYNMLRLRLVDNPVFALWLNRCQRPGPGGELMLGGVNPRRFSGRITFHTLTGANYWQFGMDNVLIGNESVGNCPSTGCQAMFDSGVSLLAGPPLDVARINTLLNASNIMRQEVSASAPRPCGRQCRGGRLTLASGSATNLWSSTRQSSSPPSWPT